MTPDNSPRALVRYALAGLVVTAALSWTVYLVRGVLVVVYIAALVAIGLGPLVNAIERKRLLSLRQRVPRWAAILTIYLVVMGGLVVVAVLVVPPLVTQARELWTNFPELLHKGQRWLIDRGLLSRELTIREAVQQAPGGGSDAVGTLIGAVTGLVGGLFGFVTILLLAFYFLVDAEGILNTFRRLFPRSEQPRVADACVRISAKVSAWLGGQLLLAGIIGATAALGLWVMGVPYFYVLALIAALGEMIPMIGPILSAIPAIAVALTVSPTLAIAVAIFFFVQQQLENNILVPNIMQRQVGVSAVVVIIALLLGGALLGIVGAILAVPTAAILQVLFEELRPDTPES
ncbi:MAG: AI-2E family transporter [Vicinamibacterales bacterium]